MEKEKNTGYMEEAVIVSGTGKTRDEAFARAMSSVQKTLTKQVTGTIIRIEPLSVEFLEGKEVTSTEKFLFLFFKREVSTYTIKIKVKVSLYVVDVNSFEIESVRETRLLKKLLG